MLEVKWPTCRYGQHSVSCLPRVFDQAQTSEVLSGYAIVAKPQKLPFSLICTSPSSVIHSNVTFSSFSRISEIEPKYYADGEDAYAMRRDLVVWSKQEGIAPADADSFFRAKNSEDKKKNNTQR